MKKPYLSFCLFCVVFTGFAQVDSLSVSERLSTIGPPKHEIISKSRQLLLQDFKAGNKDEVNRTLRYLATEIDDEYHTSLWPPEQLLFAYWLGHYSDIILSGQMRPNAVRYERGGVHPSDYVLFIALRNTIKENDYEAIISDFKSMHFTPDVNEYLTLLLSSLLEMESDDKINEKADRFINDYPDSPLLDATKKYISTKMKRSDWAFDMQMGGGYHWASGTITDRLTQAGGIVMGLNLMYKKMIFGLSIIPSFGRTKQDIPLPNGYEYPQNLGIDITKFTLTLGYTVWNHKRFSLSPFAGVSFNSFGNLSDEEKKDYPEWENFKIETSKSPVFGFDFDCVIATMKIPNYYYDVSNMESSCSLGLKVAYYPNLIANFRPNLHGQTLFIGLSLKASYYNLKKAYP